MEELDIFAQGHAPRLANPFGHFKERLPKVDLNVPALGWTREAKEGERRSQCRYERSSRGVSGDDPQKWLIMYNVLKVGI